MSRSRIFLAVLAVLATTRSAAAQGAAASTRAPLAATANELVERAKALDGAVVVFEGEAIGDPLPRGDHAWVNVLDGGGAIGVWLPRGDLGQIEHYGSYRWKGDRLRVVGVFHRACPEHGGDLDIHATSLEVIERGAAIPHPASPAEIALAAVLLAAGLLALILWRRREAERRSATW